MVCLSAQLSLMQVVFVCVCACVCLQEHNHPRDSSYSKGAVSRYHEQGHLSAVRPTGSYVHPSSVHWLRLFWYVTSLRLGLFLICAHVGLCL